jgi:alpha-ketoglutarate-dependent taurine dioxygenase
MKIEPVTDAFGAVISAVSLAALSDNEFQAIETAWYRYAVLLFPTKHLTEAENFAFSRRFGRLERGLQLGSRPSAARIANVDANNQLLPPSNLSSRFNIGNSVWHTDSSYKSTAAKASVLAAYAVPASGGETEWADMRAGYDVLGTSMKAWLEDKVAIHSFRFSHAWHGGLEVLNNADLANLPPVEHPVTQEHPDSGRKILFIGRHASHIAGQPVAASRKLLRRLTDQSAQPPRTWKHQWSPGDLVIWDNRCVLHRGHAFDPQQARVMVRTTVAGDAPDNQWAA